MNLISEQSEQKLRGGYYTPAAIGKYLWHWIVEVSPTSILEPAAGDGALIGAIEDDDNLTRVLAIEKNETESEKINNDHLGDKLVVENADFFDWYESNTQKVHSVLANPPYIRYQYLSEKQRQIQSEILVSNGMKSNKLINAWVAFVVASVELLEAGGRVGVVIPTDFLQVTYAKELRTFLLNQLSKMYLVTFEESMFPGTQQDFLLLLGQKKLNSGDTEIEFKHIVAPALDDIPNWNGVMATDVPDDGKQKWSELFLNDDDRQFVDELAVTQKKFTDIAKVEVGITTGGNSLFSLNERKMNELRAEKFVVPMLGRSTEASGVFFDKQELERLRETDKNVWLLNLKGEPHSEFPRPLSDYLKRQELEGNTDAYKLKIREFWFEIPGVWAPDAFMLRRIGPLPKMILNNVGGVSTDTFHRVRIKSQLNKALVIFAFYSSVSMLSLELSGRVFGGGALEILPGDTADMLLPDLDYRQNFDMNSPEMRRLDELVAEGEPDEIVNFVDEILATNFGANYDRHHSQAVWHELRNQRL